MKKVLSFALVLALVLSLGVSSFATPVRADDESTAAQLNLIYSSLASIRQNETSGVWSYSVTDLDHNGRLEVLATMKDANRTTFVNVWEVNAEQNALAACKVNIPQGQSFPYLYAENADTFYDSTTDTWAYMFYDNMVLNTNDVYTFKSSVTLKDGMLSFTQHATQVTSNASGGYQQTAFFDAGGNPISPEQYNSAGVNAFASANKSSTNFGWFGYATANNVSVLADSYAVFKGLKQPDKTVPVVAYTPAPQSPSTPAYLSITKSPTSESHYTGETAYFVSNATTWTSLSWTFVSTYGGEYSVEGFQSIFPGSPVGGSSSTTLTVSNVTNDMSGWGVYCTFYYNGQTARTNTAYLYVTTKTYTSTTPILYGPSYYSAYGTDIHTQDRNGTQIYQHTDGSVTYFYTDGTGIHLDSTGTVTDFDEYGNSTTYFTDGSSYTEYSTGTSQYDDTDGTSYIDYGDGSGSIIYDDGSYMDFEKNGSFTIYGTDGSVVGGGMDYDYPEVYSSEYGWGSFIW